MREQLEPKAEGHPGVLEAGHAAIRFVNSTTDGDALPTIRADAAGHDQTHRADLFDRLINRIDQAAS